MQRGKELPIFWLSSVLPGSQSSSTRIWANKNFPEVNITWIWKDNIGYLRYFYCL
jgi:hypothetical protein